MSPLSENFGFDSKDKGALKTRIQELKQRIALLTQAKQNKELFVTLPSGEKINVQRDTEQVLKDSFAQIKELEQEAGEQRAAELKQSIDPKPDEEAGKRRVAELQESVNPELNEEAGNRRVAELKQSVSPQPDDAEGARRAAAVKESVETERPAKQSFKPIKLETGKPVSALLDVKTTTRINELKHEINLINSAVQKHETYAKLPSGNMISLRKDANQAVIYREKEIRDLEQAAKLNRIAALKADIKKVNEAVQKPYKGTNRVITVPSINKTINVRNEADKTVKELEDEIYKLEGRKPTTAPDTTTGKDPEGSDKTASSDQENPDTVEPDGFDPNQPHEVVYGIDISEIVKRIAWQEAEKRLNDILYAPEEDLFDTKVPEAKKNSKWERFKSMGKSILNTVSAPFRHPVKWGKKVKTRVIESYYREKFYQEELNKIVKDQNLMAKISKVLSGQDVTDNMAWLQTIVNEYKSEIVNQVEKGNNVNNPQLNADIADLASKAVAGNWDHQRINQEVRNLLNAAKAAGTLKNADFAGTSGRDSEVQGLMYASNLAEVIENYKQEIESKITELGGPEALENPELKEALLEHVKGVMQIDVKLGLKLSDLHNKRPKGSFGALDNLIRRCQGIPILGHIVNPLSLGLVTGIGTRLATLAGKKKIIAGLGIAAGAATMSIAPILVGAGLAGVVAAIRRNVSLKHDRGMDQRREVLGEEVNGRRTDQMRRFAYDVVDLETLLNGGDHNYRTTNYKFTGAKVQEQLRKYLGLNQIEQSFSDKDALLKDPAGQEVAEMLARFLVELQRDKTTNKKGTVDLFKVTNEEGTETRTSYNSKVQFKEALFNYLVNLGLIDKNTLDADVSTSTLALQGILDTNFENLVKTKMQELNQHIEQQDKAFNTFRKESALKTFAGVATVGTIFGATIGKYVAKAVDWVAHNYLGLNASIPSAAGVLKHGSSYNVLDDINANGKNIGFHGAGIYALPLPGGTNTVDVFIDAQGQIDPSRLPTGWHLSGNSLIHTITHAPAAAGTVASAPASWDNFAAQHGGTSTIHYQDFLSNGTPPKGITIFDHLSGAEGIAQANLTELQMDYSVDSQGNWLIDMSRMLGKTATNADGKLSINLEDYLKNGGVVKMLLSPDRATQHNPIEVLIQLVNGKATATVPHDLAQNFVSMTQKPDGTSVMEYVNGMPKIHGLHQLVVESGINPDGSKNVVGLAARFGEAPTLTIPGSETPSLPGAGETSEEVIDLNWLRRTVATEDILPENMPVDTVGIPLATDPRLPLENRRLTKEEKEELKKILSEADEQRTSENTRKSLKERFLGILPKRKAKGSSEKQATQESTVSSGGGDGKVAKEAAEDQTEPNPEVAKPKKTWKEKLRGWFGRKQKPAQEAKVSSDGGDGKSPEAPEAVTEEQAESQPKAAKAKKTWKDRLFGWWINREQQPKAPKKRSQVPHTPEPNQDSPNLKSATKELRTLNRHGSELLETMGDTNRSDLTRLVNQAIENDSALGRKLNLIRGIEAHNVVNILVALFHEEYEDHYQTGLDQKSLFTRIIVALRADSKTLYRSIAIILGGHELPLTEIHSILERIDRTPSKTDTPKDSSDRKTPEKSSPAQIGDGKVTSNVPSRIEKEEFPDGDIVIDKTILSKERQEEARKLGAELMKKIPNDLIPAFSEAAQQLGLELSVFLAILYYKAVSRGEKPANYENFYRTLLADWEERKLTKPEEPIKQIIADSFANRPRIKPTGTPRPVKPLKSQTRYELGETGIDDLQSRFAKLIPDFRQREQFMLALVTEANKLGILPEDSIESARQGVLERALTKWEQLGTNLQVFENGRVRPAAIQALLAGLAEELGITEIDDYTKKDMLKEVRQRNAKRSRNRDQKRTLSNKEERERDGKILEASDRRTERQTAEQRKTADIEQLGSKEFIEVEGEVEPAEILQADATRRAEIVREKEDKLKKSAVWELENMPLTEQTKAYLLRLHEVVDSQIKNRLTYRYSVDRLQARSNLINELLTGQFTWPNSPTSITLPNSKTKITITKNAAGQIELAQLIAQSPTDFKKIIDLVVKEIVPIVQD